MYSFERKIVYFPFRLTKISQKWAENEEMRQKQLFLPSKIVIYCFYSRQGIDSNSGSLVTPAFKFERKGP